MGGTRTRSVAILSAFIVVLSGCNSSDSKNVSLDEYVKKECALTVDFKDRMAHLTHDFATNAKNQEALADTVQSIADLYDELLAKTKELGDSPNGEGKDDSGEVEQAARSLADTLGKVATDIRGAKNDAEAQAAMNRMNDAIVKSTTTAEKWQKSHPTPELDRLKKAYPGCSDEPG
jgi:methyl-accepting chemotaxis protein